MGDIWYRCHLVKEIESSNVCLERTMEWRHNNAFIFRSMQKGHIAQNITRGYMPLNDPLPESIPKEPPAGRRGNGKRGLATP
jgi:hypothetical protein